MLTCPKCKAENKDGEVICYRCGNLLVPVAVKGQSSTKHLRNQTDKLAYPTDHWRTRALDPESVVTFDESAVTFNVRGFDEALQVVLETELILGRSASTVQVDIDLTPYGASEKGVSRRHAKLKRRNDTVTVTDLGSSNSTYINGQKVAIDEERIVRDGDEIRLGRLVIKVKFGEQN